MRLVFSLMMMLTLVCTARCTDKESFESVSDNSFVYCEDGLLREPSGEELLLFGVNLQPCLSWEFNSRLRKYGVGLSDLHSVIDGNLEELLLMKVNMVRCHLTPADFTDASGNLVQTPYLDALDYMIAKAGEKGIYVTLAFINHMGNYYVEDSFIRNITREDWIHLKHARDCSRNYIRQLLQRQNPYTESSYAKESSIAYWELVNEPSMYSWSQISMPEHRNAFDEFSLWAETSGRAADQTTYADFRSHLVRNYIDGLISLIKDCGSAHPVIWSHNWHRYRTGNEDIFAGALNSLADGFACCNYPGQDYVSQDYWNKPVDLSGRDYTDWFNTYFDNVDGYGWMRLPEYKDRAKVVYEFETFFNQSTWLYPVQAQFFRTLGVQAASMWTYCMKEYAQYHAGSHFLSLTCTPGKAVAFIIAQQVFKTTQRGRQYDRQLSEQIQKNLVISKTNDLAIFSDEDRLYHTGGISGFCPVSVSRKVREIIGIGNSPIVSYTGTGIYFINDTDEGLQLRLMPDHKWIQEPWNSRNSGLVSELDHEKVNTMSIELDRWKGGDYTIWKLEDGQRHEAGRTNSLSDLNLKPGNYLITRNK